MRKAVGLFSGGLDSAIAVKLMQEQGIEVHAVYFLQPWCEEDTGRIKQVADELGVYFRVGRLGSKYFDMLLHPEQGYGKAFNPCVDCHRFMVREAGKIMREIGADFVFTGEVVGQRPMSQRKHCLPLVEKGTGLEGFLVRPLSARILEETVPEKNKWLDRGKLLNLSGRSRRHQMDLARKWGITLYKPTGGGCLITERCFGARLKDFLSWPYREAGESAVLKWGRYFRLDPRNLVILGRDACENELLERHAHGHDILMQLKDIPGPLALVKTAGITDRILETAAGLIQYFSKARDQPACVAVYRAAHAPDDRKEILAQKLSDKEIRPLTRETE